MIPVAAELRSRGEAAARALVSALPDSLGRRLRPSHYRGVPASLPSVSAMPEAPVRVLIGSFNTAGQGWAWARALERDDEDVRAVSLSRADRGFSHPVDIAIPEPLLKASRDWQREHLRVRGLSATDVVIESGLPIFGPAVGWSLEREVRVLQRQGIRVVVICHGSDVRNVAALNARNEFSPYRDPQYDSLRDAMDRRSRAVRRAIRRAGVPVLGSTHGVLLDLPGAQWCPVVIEPEQWSVDTAPFTTSDLPLLVHAPSNPIVKGSDVVDRVARRLEAEGRLRYERLTGVAHGKVRDAYRRADILVDSLRTGAYGVAACEAMAAGRTVISHVSADYRDAIRTNEHLELPIIEADPLTLEDVLIRVLDDPAWAQAIAARGPSYVRALHDGRVSSARIRHALASPRAAGRHG